MKKFFAITLAIVMMMAMATTAFAAEGSSTKKDGESQDITVNAKYNNGMTEQPVVSVNVAWGAMEFTYNVSGTQTWLPDSHTYSTNTGTPSWSASGNTVTITNHSNIDVKVKTEYKPEETYKDITGTFSYTKTAGTDDFITLTRGQVNMKDSADNVVATLNLRGELASSVNASTKVGTITVTIKK